MFDYSELNDESEKQMKAENFRKYNLKPRLTPYNKLPMKNKSPISTYETILCMIIGLGFAMALYYSL